MFDKEIIEARLKKHLKEAMRENDISDWFVIASNGSTNYGLDTAESDIDSKLLTIPSLKKLINNKRDNYLYIMSDNGEHVEVKDVSVYMNTILKQNINFVETLFAKGVIVNPKYKDEWQALIDNREIIAHYDTHRAVKCMYGMMVQKRKDMMTMTDGRRDSIERIGYDAKSFHHVVRLYCFLISYIIGCKYEDCLTDHIDIEYDMLMKSKMGEYDIDDAIYEADSMIASAKRWVDGLCSRDVRDVEIHNRWDVKNLIDDVVYNVIEKSLCENYVGQM